MAKYKVGDVVLVREDLVLHRPYRMDNGFTEDSVVESMMKFAGEEVEIRYVGDKYLIHGNSMNWTDEMFAGLVGEVRGQVTEVSDLL